MRKARPRQLTGVRPGRELRWTQTRTQSLRAYSVKKQDGAWPCVSTRSGELTIVLEGEMILELGPNKQVVRVGAGEVCMMPRCMPHALCLEGSARLLIVDVVGGLAEDAFRRLGGSRLPAAAVTPFVRSWTHPASEVLPQLASAAEDLLARLGSAPPLVVESISSTTMAAATKRLVESRFADPPSLRELAKRTRASEHYVVRAFKRHYSFTPMQYAQFLRTEHFCWELLAASDRPTLLQLSGESGWGDYATFERRMRIAFGRPPSTLVIDDAEGPIGPP